MSYEEEVLIRGNPFSREYRQVLLDVLNRPADSPVVEDQPPKAEMFLAKLTDASPIRANRIWKYKWEAYPFAAEASSTGGSDDYQFFALNGPELNNAAETSGSGFTAEANATFGVKVGTLSNPPSVVTLLPLTHGPDPIVLMMRRPHPVTVTIDSTDYKCFYWISAANQVSVTCS